MPCIHHFFINPNKYLFIFVLHAVEFGTATGLDSRLKRSYDYFMRMYGIASVAQYADKWEDYQNPPNLLNLVDYFKWLASPILTEVISLMESATNSTKSKSKSSRRVLTSYIGDYLTFNGIIQGLQGLNRDCFLRLATDLSHQEDCGPLGLVSSNYILELVHKDKEYFVRTRFEGEYVNACPGKSSAPRFDCPLNHWVSRLRERVYTDWRTLCGTEATEKFAKSGILGIVVLMLGIFVLLAAAVLVALALFFRKSKHDEDIGTDVSPLSPHNRDSTKPIASGDYMMDPDSRDHAFVDKSIKNVKPHIKVAEDLTLEAYVGSSYISTQIPIEETQKINQQPYYTGLLKDDAIYFSRLEDLSKKKLNKDETPTNPAAGGLNQHLASSLAGGNPVMSIPPLETTALGKREQPSTSSAATNAGKSETKKLQVEKSTAGYMLSIPETNLASKIEFAKDYLDRKIIEKNSEPDMIKVALKDLPATVTVVEVSQNSKVVLVGFSNGQISGYFFSEQESENYNPEAKPAAPKSNLKNILDTEAEDILDSLHACNFIGHSGAITSIGFNYDTKYFVTGSTDGTARLWNIRVGECLAVFKAHTKPVWSVTLCPKGFYFATGGADSLIFLWITSKSSPVMCFNQHEADITHMEFTESLNYLVSASQDRSVRIWNLDDASCVRIIFFPEVIKKFKLTMYADIIVCGGEEGSVFVWDLVKAVKLHQFSLGKDVASIMSIKLSIDERFFVISSKNRCLYFMTSSLMQPKSKSVYDYLLSRYTLTERKLTGWEELALNGIDITHKERIVAAQATSLNQIYLVVVEIPN